MVQKNRAVRRLKDNFVPESISTKRDSERVVKVAQAIEASCGSHMVLIDSKFRVYSGLCWVEVSQKELLAFVRWAAEQCEIPEERAFHYKFGEELIAQLFSLIPQQPSIEASRILINLQNGTLDLSGPEPKLRAHLPEDYLTYVLAYSYDPKAECPQFNAFLKQVQPDEENRKLTLEAIAASFIRGNALKLEKAFWFYGSGANGKSVLFDVVLKLLGSENISNFNLADLTSKKGMHRALAAGKILNYSSESGRSLNPAIFKQLVSKEPTSAELKYQNPVNISNHPHLISNTNVLPDLREGSHGLFRRVGIIHFDVTIPKNQRDLELANRIIDSELPGVLNLLIDALIRLKKQKGYTKSSKAEQLKDDVVKEANSIESFIEEYEIASCPDGCCSLQSLFDAYRAFCATNETQRALPKRRFSRALEEKGFKKVRKSDGIAFYVKRKFFPNSSSPTSF